MNYDAHANIFRGAVAALPATLQAAIGPYEALFDDAGNYPDIFDNGTLPEADKDAHDPNWRRFCLYPPSLAGKNMHSWPFPNERQIDHLPMLAHLFDHAVDAHSAGDIEGAIKFVGCLSHYLGDICQPAHLLDQHLMEQLLPPPPDKERFHYHGTLEAVTGECAALDSPSLLGATVEEACWRLMEFNRRAIDECRGYIVPTIQALFADDVPEATRLAERPVTVAAEGTRDIFATVASIAGGTASRSASERLDLRTWYPDESSFPVAYGKAFVDKSKTTGPPLDGPFHPARLRCEDGLVREVRGLGVIGRSWLTWHYPAGLFDRFEATIGMHAELATHGAGDFIIELDSKEVFRSGPMTSADVARSVSLPLEASTSLTIKVDDPSGGLSFYHNHAIWGNPALIR